MTLSKELSTTGKPGSLTASEDDAEYTIAGMTLLFKGDPIRKPNESYEASEI
jgi:hypothetical protein